MFKIPSKIKVRKITSNILIKYFCQSNITTKIKHIPDIKTFIKSTSLNFENDSKQILQNESFINSPHNLEFVIPKTFYIETYGCQMNENDTEIITTILESNKYTRTVTMEEADIILTNTCAIRDSAEEKVWKNIHHIKGIKRRDPHKIFGILGCMAERMKEKILEKSNNIVDLIVGPDAYRDLPKMIEIISKKDESSRYAINVQLSLEETYGDIMPVRKSSDNTKAFISIMRGCNNMCSFCIVPFTRGRERSRDYSSILEEVKILKENGIKEITLLGQNVNSFIDESYEFQENETVRVHHVNSPGFRELYKLRDKQGLRFAELMDKLSDYAPDVRFRFTSPHPKDFPEELIEVIKKKTNVCKQIHMPAQSGNSDILKNMRRFYTRESYIELVNFIRQKIPLVALSSDFISGFCGETDEQFNDTITLLEEVNYDMTYLFAYSMREKTHAYHSLKDDVPEDVKKQRLIMMNEVFKKSVNLKNKSEIGTYQIVLVERASVKKNKDKAKLTGRTDLNKICLFENEKISSDIPVFIKNKNNPDFYKNLITTNNNHIYKSYIDNHEIFEHNSKSEINTGDYILVKINDTSNFSLFATPICKLNKYNDFFDISKGDPYFKIDKYDNPNIYNTYRKQ